MGKYVKTTKGVYEFERPLPPNNYISGDNHLMMFIKDHFSNGFYKDYGKIIAQSENANDLIEFVIEINKTTNEIYYVYNTTWNFHPSSLCRRIGLIRIGDDLVKVADWDNEKGEWKLYER